MKRIFAKLWKTAADGMYNLRGFPLRRLVAAGENGIAGFAGARVMLNAVGQNAAA